MLNLSKFYVDQALLERPENWENEVHGTGSGDKHLSGPVITNQCHGSKYECIGEQQTVVFLLTSLPQSQCDRCNVLVIFKTLKGAAEKQTQQAFVLCILFTTTIYDDLIS